MVAGSESRSACAIWRPRAVPVAFSFGAFLLATLFLDLGETFRGGMHLLQVTGVLLFVTRAVLPLLLLVTFGQVGKVGSLCGLKLREPVFACLFLPAQEFSRRFFAGTRFLGHPLRNEFLFDLVDESVEAGLRRIVFAEIPLSGGLLHGVEVAELLPRLFFEDAGGLPVFGFLPETQLAAFFRMTFPEGLLQGIDFFRGGAGRLRRWRRGRLNTFRGRLFGGAFALLLQRLGLLDGRDRFPVNVGHEGAQILGGDASDLPRQAVDLAVLVHQDVIAPVAFGEHKAVLREGGLERMPAVARAYIWR